MNETSEGTREHSSEPGPPHSYREQLRDFDRLRRSSTDRYVAGVCGGLGRHFGIDPTIIRILLAVMCLFGGAGLLFYAAVWLFVPEDGRAQAPIHLDSDARRVIVLVAAAIAVVGVASSSWGGFGWGGGWGAGWTIGIVAVVLAVVLGSRRRTDVPRAHAGADPQARGGSAPPQPYGEVTAQRGAVEDHGGPAGEPAAAEVGSRTSALSPAGWGHTPPPPYAPPPPPRRPRRTGMVLFWPTLALIAVGWGVLGLYDIDHHVAAAAWAALALAITGVMLLVGAFVGRPGGLILVGLLLVAALSVTAAVDNVTWQSNRTYRPTTVSQVSDSYAITNGRLVVDLSRVHNPQGLDGRSIETHLDAGEVVVVLPRGVAADVDADVNLAGSIDVGRRNENGFGPHLHERVGPAHPRAEIDLRAWAQAGHLEVRTPTAEETLR